jgi:hypothetical protein
MKSTNEDSSDVTQLPIGAVIAWWGSSERLPTDWEICDGEAAKTTGALLDSKKPDLRNKFIQGATAKNGSTDKTDSGGSNMIDLSHDHGMNHEHEAGSLYACISQQRVSGASFNIPHIASESGFVPLNDMTGGQTPSAGIDGDWNGHEDGNPKGTRISGSTKASAKRTDSALAEVDNRPEYLALYFIIRVK